MLQLLFGVIRDVLACHDDASRVGLEKTHSVMQGHRFADAAASENADRFARHHLKADVIEHDAFSCCLNLF